MSELRVFANSEGPLYTTDPYFRGSMLVSTLLERFFPGQRYQNSGEAGRVNIL
jgi:hypothetical protein